MAATDPNDQTDPTAVPQGSVEQQPATSSQPATGAVDQNAEANASAIEGSRRRILIGSQRDPAKYRARQQRDWLPVEEKPETRKAESRKRRKGTRKRFSSGPKVSDASPTADSGQSTGDAGRSGAELPAPNTAGQMPNAEGQMPNTGGRMSNVECRMPNAEGRMPNDECRMTNVECRMTNVESSSLEPSQTTESFVADPSPLSSDLSFLPPLHSPSVLPVPPPNLRERLSPELEAELSQAFAGASLDEWMGADASQADEAALEPDSLHSGRVVGVRRDDVFLELGSREQGIVSLRQFDVPPQPGAIVQVLVQRFNPEDGLYELSLPNKAVQVDDWSDLMEGKLVEVRVTGHNTGGLECEVNHIRGFIPISQVALYRVEDLAPYVEQRLTCLIAEADPDRRNLVLSRRAVLEREREQARQQLLGSLQPGQVRDGVVRKLLDFGAFVDLGGADGLLHISQLAWGRVKHPSDVLKEGQKIQVRVEKVDAQTGKISLAYRDLLESPWTDAARKYPPNGVARGVVTKLMDFGAFVELEPGVEGLVHISELSHKRIGRVSEVVREGDRVDVLVLSVDTSAQRIGLSMRALAAPAESAKTDDEAPEAAAPAAKAPRKSKKQEAPLLGGLGRRSGDRCGLKW